MARGQLRTDAIDEQEPDSTVDDALAAFGLYCEEEVVVDDEFWLWPESEEAFYLWNALQTQWVVGMNGPTGLSYPGIEACMRLYQIPKKKRPRLFDLIRAMEQATLEELS